MADHFREEQVRAIPVQSFDELRPSLRSGDLFFTASNPPVSRLIQKVTAPPGATSG
jgi:hypothetical protein